MRVVPAEVEQVMGSLQERDARDRVDGTSRAERLRAVTRDVGEFLCTLALATGARTIVEIGTSGGYSTLWLAIAARGNGGRVTTFEIDPVKIAVATETFARAAVNDVVDLRHEDGVAGLLRFVGEVDLVFLDAEKHLYGSALEPIIRALRPGGTLVADNLLSHAEDLEAFRRAALEHPALSGLVVPVGRGELVAVRA